MNKVTENPAPAQGESRLEIEQVRSWLINGGHIRGPKATERAATIVRAVNCHDELVAALRTALRCMDGAGMYSRGGSDRETYLEVKAVLDKASAASRVEG